MRRVIPQTPAIVAQSAVRRLPRLALWLLCIAYILPGFLARDPWRGNDMAAFGFMRALALGQTDWWAPQLLGMAPDTQGLLPYWLGAWAMQWAAGPWLPPELAARLPFIAMLVVSLAATWHGVYWLATSRGAQPVAFAFGGEAQPTDYAHAIADGALLALLACLGLAQPAHEVSSYLTQLCCTALVFYALAASPAPAWRSGLALAVGLGGLVLSGAPVLALLYSLGGTVLYGWEYQRTPADTPHAWRSSVVVMLTGLGSGILALQLDLLHWQATLPPWSDAGSLGRLLLWFTWPAWPLALWTIWRWRKQIADRQPHRHLLLPLWFVLVGLGATLTTQPSDRALLLALPALAALAAFALPTLGRSVAALVDWFTLLFFSVSAIAIWVIWLSTQTGIPAKPAANVARLAPGFIPEFSPLALLVALTASAAWCALVAWRAGRHRAAIWKSLVLPAAGATLSWLLLLTLWLPMLDYARSDAPQTRAIMAVLQGQPACVYAYGLSRTQVAALQYHGKLSLHSLPRLRPNRTDCDWLVASHHTQLPVNWVGVWQEKARIARPTEKTDLLVVYQRRWAER